VAFDPNGLEVDSIAFPKALLPAANILPCSGSSFPVTQFTRQISGDGPLGVQTFEEWFAGYAELGYTLRFRSIVDPEDNVLEIDEGNNVLTHLPAFDLIPLSGNLLFDVDVVTTLTAFELAKDDPLCPLPLSIRFITGTASWLPSSNGLWPAVDLNLVGICAVANINAPGGDALDLEADPGGGGATAPVLNGELGGYPVVLEGVTLDADGIHAAGPLTLTLPEGHSLHVNDSGRPRPRGTHEAIFTDINPGVDLGFMEALLFPADHFLQVNGLPFSFRLFGLLLDASGIRGEFSGIVYAYDLPWAAEDPRALSDQGPESNDRRFAVPAAVQPETTFTLPPTGLIAEASFEGGSGWAHYPSLDMSWAGFSVNVSEGRLVDGQTISGTTTSQYSFRQSADCALCESGGSAADPNYTLTIDRKEGIGSDGAVMAHTAALGTEPAWGPRVAVPSSGSQNVFRRINDATAAAVIFLPGFEARATGGPRGDPNVPVVRYLLGAREASSGDPNEIAPGTHFDANSPTARRGNEFMAGVTVGPQTYSDPDNAQPSARIGQNLSGSMTRIAFGGAPPPDPDVQSIPSNAGTKYVIRRGGITGVFNADAAAAPALNVYGYSFDLRRFAFRQIQNVLDEQTWIDGRIPIPGKADFQIFFSSFGLECSGELNTGVIDRETCDDGIDNNGNGEIDENCRERLRAWRTTFDLLSMSFVPPEESEGLCDGGNRLLEVASVIDIQALDGELGLVALWDPNGEPLTPRFSGRRDRVLDEPSVPETDDDRAGFDYALEDEIELRAISNSNDEGWFEFRGSLAVPFWDALPIKARLENESEELQDQSILVRREFELPDDESNDEAANQLRLDSERDSSAVYTWGSTGFSIPSGRLPLYYERDRYLTKAPRFLCRTQEVFNLVVMNAKAGVDFVDPLRTKLSFGASANFELLSQLEVDLHVDLNDPESISRIDRFLNRLGVRNTPVGTLVSNLKDRMNLMNAVVDAGLDGFLEEAVHAALQPVPFGEMADAIGQVQGIPEEAASAVSGLLTSVVDPLTVPLNSDLDDAMIEVYVALPQLIFDTLPAGPNNPPDVDALNSVITKLQNVDDALTEVVRVIDGLGGADGAESALGRARDDFQGVLSQTEQWVNDANSAITGVQALIAATQLTACDETNPLRSQINQVRNRVNQAKQALGSVDLVTFANRISAAVGVNLGAISSAQRDLLDLVEDVEARITSASGAIDTGLAALCGPAGYGGILDDANAFLGSIQSAVSGVTGAMTNLDNELNSADPNNNLFDRIGRELDTAREIVVGAQGAVHEVLAAARDVRDGRFPPATFTSVANIQSELNSWMRTATADLPGGGSDWCNAACDRGFVRDLADLVRNPIDQAIQDTANAVTNQLGALTGVFPHPSGEELRGQVVDLVMNSSAAEEVNRIFYASFSEIGGALNGLSLRVFDQLNQVIQDLLEAVEDRANELLQAATGSVPAMPLKAAKVDGYAVMAGNELERLHVGAFWTMSDDDADEENTTRYGAALDVTSWSANGKDEGCVDESGSSLLDAQIAAYNVPIEVGPSEITIRVLSLGFTIAAGGVPVGVFGGISTEGEIDFQAFQIYDPAFHSGVGADEVYVGAKAGAIFDRIQMEVAFLVGKTCNLEVLRSLDPQVAEFIELPDGGFNGAFVRGSASFPVWDNGCFLTVGVGADAGAWLIIGPQITIGLPPAFGGLLGGAAYGTVVCLASLRGQITLFGQKVGNNFSFRGDGFGVGGLGFDCDPHTWTTVPRSRRDSWCGTGDAQFSATYNRGFELGRPSTSAIH
jgi:hypothetical protein